MSAQRGRSAVAPDQRSAHPDLLGLPWWAAVAVAVAAAGVGIMLDAGSGHKELTVVFAALYALGCLAAVLAVRQSALFTAVIQPPLILFFAVPGAYWLFHGGAITDLKGILINCGYPLIERFPLMLFTSAAVLLTGMGRWYFDMARPATPDGDGDDTDTAPEPSMLTKLTTTLAGMVRRAPAHVTGPAPSRRRRTADRTNRPSRTRSQRQRSATARRSTSRSTSTRSRRVRPPVDDAFEPPEPRRRPRTAYDRDRDRPMREGRRDRHSSRSARPMPRRSRFDADQPLEPPPPRRRTTHHPISRVRYRGDEPSKQPHERGAESWEYDI